MFTVEIVYLYEWATNIECYVCKRTDNEYENNKKGESDRQSEKARQINSEEGRENSERNTTNGNGDVTSNNNI